MKLISSAACFGGEQRVYSHASRETQTEMRVAVFVPPQAQADKVPVIWCLAGLTCTEENFTVKAGAQRVAAELGIMLVMPDTSPRGEGVPDDADKAYDFGLGAGFYVDATEEPWAENYRMESYLVKELPELLAAHVPLDLERQGILGHSMGGHGAMSLALRNAGRFRSVSAFAPIASPMACNWGRKALGGYLGPDESAWAKYDVCALIRSGARVAELLVDQGTADTFLETQLKPELLVAACEAAGIPLELHMRAGYDHSYYFISSFVEGHLRWHGARLGT